MFFSLSSQEDPAFPNHYGMGKLVLNTDNGWRETTIDNKKFLYKGYIDSASWDRTVLAQLTDHGRTGNFLVFCFDGDIGQISVVTNKWRGFLIWTDPGSMISNLYRGSYTIWNDSTIMIDQDLIIEETKIDIIGDTDLRPRHKADVVAAIDDILQTRVSDFLSINSLPMRVFCSGGIDSTLVWSYIKRNTKSYDLVLENRIQWDHFWCHNSHRVTKNFWGYQQIHHWLDPCVLTSGAPGDEFMFRSPTTTNLWCMYHDINIFDLLSRPSLHRDYFMKQQHQDLFRQQHRDVSLDPVMRLPWAEFVWYLCNIVINDCQHWHLGNTLTFTPLRDLDIFKLMLSLSPTDLVPQILDSAISKDLISNNDQDLLSVLSDAKNTGESLSNLCSLVSR